MTDLDKKFLEIRRFCEQHANPANVKKYSWYFTEGYDAYGLDRETLENQRDIWLEAWKNEMTPDDYLLLGDKLVSTGKYEEASYAIVFMANFKDQLDENHFNKIGHWLDDGIINWGHTDALSSLILSYFFINNQVKPDALKAWTLSPSKWKKRAIPVTLIDVLKKGAKPEPMLEIIDPLMADKDKFVQKGLGWFLRELWKIYPEITENFLMKWKDTCGRIIIQYASEKMNKDQKIKFKKIK